MRTPCILLTSILITSFVARVHADCPLDHFRVGQHDGRMISDNWQVYRHWNQDYGSNPNPYAQSYYEWIQTIMGSYNRTEPGPGYIDDPNYQFPGTPNVDYRIMLQRIYASPDMSIYEGVSPILLNDGDAVCTSTYTDFHFHMRFLVADEPNRARYVMLRYYDDFFDPNDPNAGGYAPSLPWVVHYGAEPNYYSLDLAVSKAENGDIIFDPEPPLRIVGGAHFDPNHEPNDPPAYPEGLPVTLTAVPHEGEAFNKWVIYDPNFPGDANHATEDANLSIALVMEADQHVEAKFKCGSGVGEILPMALLTLGACGFLTGRRRCRAT